MSIHRLGWAFASRAAIFSRVRKRVWLVALLVGHLAILLAFTSFKVG
jgi:hypothetical protein